MIPREPCCYWGNLKMTKNLIMLFPAKTIRIVLTGYKRIRRFYNKIKYTIFIHLVGFYDYYYHYQHIRFRSIAATTERRNDVNNALLSCHFERYRRKFIETSKCEI